LALAVSDTFDNLTLVDDVPDLTQFLNCILNECRPVARQSRHNVVLFTFGIELRVGILNLSIVKLSESLTEQLVLLPLIALLAIDESLLALVVVVDQLGDAHTARLLRGLALRRLVAA